MTDNINNLPRAEAPTEPTLKEFCLWLVNKPGWWLPALMLLAGNTSPKELINYANVYQKASRQDGIPEFIQYLAGCTPGQEAKAVSDARAILLREVREFARGEE